MPVIVPAGVFLKKSLDFQYSRIYTETPAKPAAETMGLKTFFPGSLFRAFSASVENIFRSLIPFRITPPIITTAKENP
jgi:hypothetical protein